MRALARRLIACAAIFLAALPYTAGAQQGMSAELHRQAQEINEMMSAGNNQQAISRLTVLRARGNLNNYEKAILSQLLGYAHAGAGNYPKAVEAFEDALGFNALPAEIAGAVTTALVQMYLETRDYERARQRIEQMLAASGQAPDPDFLAVAAYVYFELKQYPQAERHLLQAIAAVQEPKENWYQILLAIYRAQQAWPKAEAVLQDLLVRFPDKFNYWQYLSYVLFEQGKEHEALAALMLAYRLDLIKGDELERVAGLHANIGVPEKAARMLEEWMREGELEATGERLSLTGRLWLVARERTKAKETLTLAAQQAKDGEIDLLLGKLHYEDENWEPAMTHFQAALSKGGLDDSLAEAQLLLGVSAYHAAKPDTAATALEAAGKDKKYENHAKYWLMRLKEGKVQIRRAG